MIVWLEASLFLPQPSLEQQQQAGTAFGACAFWPAAELRDRAKARPANPPASSTCDESLPAKISRLPLSFFLPHSSPFDVLVTVGGVVVDVQDFMGSCKRGRCFEDVGGSKPANEGE